MDIVEMLQMSFVIIIRQKGKSLLLFYFTIKQSNKNSPLRFSTILKKNIFIVAYEFTHSFINVSINVI